MEGASVRLGVSAWQQMLRAVLDVDERKVEDCKDDIDTLLVFAGLFSAVLTAFLVQSYTILQPDPHDEMTFLLRQSLLMNYTISSGYMNSTPPVLETPPFEAPLWAVRVNALWFASLVCSLATASIAMLVKQWLREYLAIEWTVPQEKLRAWQYRKAAIADWKVFGIASALPLLLQASLALFFLGLCFFTNAIDDRIGRSTMPLVAGWAFFFVMTTLAPLASPRCPYKIPPLKGIQVLGRRYLMLAFAWRSSISAAARAWMSITNTVLSLAVGVRTTIRRASHPSLPCTVGSLLSSIAIALQGHQRLIKLSLARFRRWLQLSGSLFLRPSEALREEQVVKEAKEDLDLLLSIDAAMVNDGLLQPMLDLVHCKNSHREALLPFAAKLLEHRIGAATPHPQSNGGLRPTVTGILSPLAQDMVRDVLHRLAAEAVSECVEQTEILLYIDSSMLDDSLLKTMWELVRRSAPPLKTDALHAFALRILEHRISPAPDFPVPCKLCTATIAMDVTALSAEAFGTVSTLVLHMISTRASEPGSAEDRNLDSPGSIFGRSLNLGASVPACTPYARVSYPLVDYALDPLPTCTS